MVTPVSPIPVFSGFAEEKSAGKGMGYNVSIPLPESVDGRRYEAGHEKVLGRIRRFAPAFVVLCLGLDTSKKDPTGSWDLSPADFEDSGRAVGRLKIPVLVVQEGGYNTRTLGQCAVRFFRGLWDGMFGL